MDGKSARIMGKSARIMGKWQPGVQDCQSVAGEPEAAEPEAAEPEAAEAEAAEPEAAEPAGSSWKKCWSRCPIGAGVFVAGVSGARLRRQDHGR
jgi:hypothetical protein